jgi:hypothetical protein
MKNALGFIVSPNVGPLSRDEMAAPLWGGAIDASWQLALHLRQDGVHVYNRIVKPGNRYQQSIGRERQKKIRRRAPPGDQHNRSLARLAAM